MAQILVRKLDDDVKARLQQRATKRGRSLEEEVRSILRAEAFKPEPEEAEEGWATRIARQFAPFNLTEDDFPPLPPSYAKPADFAE